MHKAARVKGENDTNRRFSMRLPGKTGQENQTLAFLAHQTAEDAAHEIAAGSAADAARE